MENNVKLQDIAIKARTMQLYYQTAHNLVKGTVFYQDHESLGEYYIALGCAYDAIIERAIQLEGDSAADLTVQLKQIYQNIKDMPSGVKENKEYFIKGLELEKDLCECIAKHIEKECSPGTEQLIGDVADKSEVRQYLISRRLK